MVEEQKAFRTARASEVRGGGRGKKTERCLVKSFMLWARMVLVVKVNSYLPRGQNRKKYSFTLQGVDVR